MILAPEHRRPLTEVQRAILREIVTRTDEHGVQPSQAEIGARVALHASSVNRELKLVEAGGWIDHVGARGVVVAVDLRAEIRGETLAAPAEKTIPEAVEAPLEPEPVETPAPTAAEVSP